MAKKVKGLKRRKYCKSSKVLNCNVKGLLSKIVFIGSFCPFVCWKTMKCAQRPNWDSAGTEIEQATSWVSVSATVAAYVGCWGAAPLSLSFPFSVSQLFLPGLNSLGTRPDNTTPIVTISCIWFPWLKIYRSRLVDVYPAHVLVTTYWTTDRSSDWRWSTERTFFCEVSIFHVWNIAGPEQKSHDSNANMIEELALSMTLLLGVLSCHHISKLHRNQRRTFQGVVQVSLLWRKLFDIQAFYTKILSAWRSPTLSDSPLWRC